MLTPEEIMTNVANEHSYETWDELMHDSHPHWQIHCTKEAMERYAKQFMFQYDKISDKVFCGNCGKQK